jgi:hypothetical protein
MTTAHTSSHLSSRVPARRLRFAVTTAMAIAGVLGCRDIDDLEGSITANIFVVGVEENLLVQVDVDGQRLRANPEAGDNLVAFALSLPTGAHAGQVTVFEVEDEDEGQVLKPRQCGPFSVTVGTDDDNPVAVAVVVDDLPECEGEDIVDDPIDVVEGESPGEGEGEDTAEDPGEGEGEGEGP